MRPVRRSVSRWLLASFSSCNRVRAAMPDVPSPLCRRPGYGNGCIDCQSHWKKDFLPCSASVSGASKSSDRQVPKAHPSRSAAPVADSEGTSPSLSARKSANTGARSVFAWQRGREGRAGTALLETP